MRRCVGVTAFRQQLSEKAHRWKVRGRNCLNLVAIGRSIPIDQVSSAERSAHYDAWGAMGLTNEQQVDEVGGSWRPVALYSRAGSRRICDSAR